MKGCLTVKQIREYADALRAKGIIADELKSEIEDYIFINTEPQFEMADKIYLDSDTDHVYVPALNEKGYPMLGAFKWGTIDRDTKYDMEIPVMRGFSDTPETRPTNFTTFDVSCACDMKLANKVYPWQLKQIYNADEFGLEEDEFDELLENACRNS